MTSSTMASLKKVGIKLGEATKKSGFMRDNIEHLYQHQGELISKSQILEVLGEEQAAAIDNCFHHGYVLREKRMGREYYFIPALPEQELIALRNQFRKLEDSPDEKLRLIQKLLPIQTYHTAMEEASEKPIEARTSSSGDNLSIPDVVENSQKSSGEGESKKEFPAQQQSSEQGLRATILRDIEQHKQEIEELKQKLSEKEAMVKALKSVLEKT